MKYEIFTGLRSAISIMILFGSFSTAVLSQEKHTHTHDEHSPGGLELGASIGYVYLEEEKADGVNLHLHLMKRLSEYFSIGAGVERIFSNEAHYGAMITLGIHPSNNLTLSVSPGREWAKHDGEWESGYATHIEASYMFEGSGFHYGPTVGYSKTQEDKHYTLGIHFGFPL